MTEMMEEKKGGGAKLIEVGFEKLFCPTDFLGERISPELLQWLVSPNLTGLADTQCAQGQIQVMRKPRTHLEKYLVIGGVFAYLRLLARAWNQNMMVVYWPNMELETGRRKFLSDLQLTLYGLRSSPVASTLRATILMALAGDRDCAISAPQSMIQSGNHALLREICGFDSRAYKRVSKEGIPEPVIEAIESNGRLLKRND